MTTLPRRDDPDFGVRIWRPAELYYVCHACEGVGISGEVSCLSRYAMCTPLECGQRMVAMHRTDDSAT